MHCYLCHLKDDIQPHLLEHEAARWLGKSELEEVKWLPADVEVIKADMMIFNQHAVDEWTVRKEPLCLILCDADEFQKQKKKLIAIGESQIKKKYDSKLAELKKQDEDKQLKIDEYYNKLDSLEKEYQNALKHMDEKEGIIREYKKREYFEKPSATLHQKKTTLERKLLNKRRKTEKKDY